jgi:quercetin dioxygenase-like cupin family protein
MRIIAIALLVCVCAVVAVVGLRAYGQMQLKAPVSIAMTDMPVTLAAGDYDVVNQLLDLMPGGYMREHHHGGPVIVMVISGELTVTDNKGTRVLTAGQSMTEQTEYVHTAANNGTEIAHLAVTYVIPKGAARTIIVR